MGWGGAGVGTSRFGCRQRGGEETINLGNGPLSVSPSAGSTRAEGKVHADRRAESPRYRGGGSYTRSPNGKARAHAAFHPAPRSGM